MTLDALSDIDLFERDRSLMAVLGRRIAGQQTIDEWGLDVDLVGVAASLLPLRIAVAVDGAHLVPDGPTLIVHDRTPLGIERAVVAVGLGTALQRSVRFTGSPDLPVIGPVLARLGGVSGHGADIRGLLHDGHLVAVGLDRTRSKDRRTGALPASAAHAAVAVGVPILPVCVRPAGPGSRARLHIGEPVPTRRRRRARPDDELDNAVRTAIADLRVLGRLDG